MSRTSKQVQIQFDEKATKAQIFAALDTVFRVHGCLTCGLRGIDLTILGGDPEFAALGEVEGVAGFVVRA
jgi:hypothetical protein